MGEALKERNERLSPDEANRMRLPRVEKIDFSGKIHLGKNKETATTMIVVKQGDLLVSGINVQKGAISIYEAEKDACATIHYSAYEILNEKLNVDYLKWFMKSSMFRNILVEQTGGGIKTELKPKRFLSLKIDLPGIDEQKHIARVHDTNSRLINKFKYVNANSQERLRELRQGILQLAVQGKLVPQDPNDEPATVLLEKIRAEKERLIKEKKIKKSETLPPIGKDEIPYELPKGWAWARTNEIADHRLGKMLDVVKNKGQMYPYLRNVNVQWMRFNLNDLKEMKFESSEIEEYELKKDDLLVCEGGEPGRCAIWDAKIRPMMFQKAIHRIRLLGGIEPWYLLYCLYGDAQSGRLAEQFTGATIKHFTGQELARYIVGLPPPNEQRRIIVKLKELLSLCDELETNLTHAEKASEQLLEAVVREVVG